MSKLTVEWAENKSEDWKVVSVQDEAGKSFKDCSLNRTSKKGEIFPGFDEILPGSVIEGTLWTSDAGKNYIFPPRPEGEKKGGAGIKAAQERKLDGINRTLDRKENGIELSSTFRDATLETNLYFQLKGKDYSNAEWEAHWVERRNWLKANYGDMGDISETKEPVGV